MRWWRAGAAVDERRWVVVDVESSGLDPARDRLLAIAAVALHRSGGRPGIALADSFELVLRQPPGAVDKANILVHGVGLGAQRAGTEPALAWAAFERWVGRAPLLAFHAAFDRTLIDRAMRAALGRRLANPWLDVAALAAALHPERPERSLDDWLAHFGLHCLVRHQAASDALVTAELLLRLGPALQRQQVRDDWAELCAAADGLRWLRP